jgi:hypothetical protein
VLCKEKVWEKFFAIISNETYYQYKFGGNLEHIVCNNQEKYCQNEKEKFTKQSVEG